MKRQLPTILTLLVCVLIGAMYWVDISYYTSAQTGFVTHGSPWMRYLVLILPFCMGILGLRLVGPRAISILRLRSRPLAVLFAVAGVIGAVNAIAQIVKGITNNARIDIAAGLLFVWYSVWMFLGAIQMLEQRFPSPTKSAFSGIFAVLPYCYITVTRVLLKPTSLYRAENFTRSISSLFVMLWLGMLLRALYIALTRRRVRWMYISGVFTFLFATCLEMPQAIHKALFGNTTATAVIESINIGFVGLVAICMCIVIAKQGAAEPPEEVYVNQVEE